MEDDTEIDDFLGSNTSNESGHNNEVGKVDLQLKLQDTCIMCYMCNCSSVQLHKT